MHHVVTLSFVDDCDDVEPSTPTTAKMKSTASFFNFAISSSSDSKEAKDDIDNFKEKFTPHKKDRMMQGIVPEDGRLDGYEFEFQSLLKLDQRMKRASGVHKS